jgi:uncharacterized protein (TIGR03066 family)
MNAVRLTMAGLLVLGLTVGAGAQDKGGKKGSVKDRLVGTWEVVKGKGVGKGDRLQFSKDGKLVVLFKKGGKAAREEASYTVAGSTLKLTVKRGDKEQTREIKIIRVADKELVLEGPRGENITLQRVARATKDSKD